MRVHCPVSAKVRLYGHTIRFHDAGISSITESILIDGFDAYEYELNRFIRAYPWPVAFFVDAGANIGVYSALAACRFDGNTNVTAIEPFPNNIAYLERLKRDNNLSFDIVGKALAERTGDRKTFYVPLTHRSAHLASSASLVNTFSGTGGVYDDTAFREITVETICLADLLGGRAGPVLLKLDIEGYELPVLKTVESILRARADIDLVVEIMINDGDKQAVFDLLTGAGYDAYLMTNAGLVRENRPLTLPYHNSREKFLRTCWKNHYFTKRPKDEIAAFSRQAYGYCI